MGLGLGNKEVLQGAQGSTPFLPLKDANKQYAPLNGEFDFVSLNEFVSRKKEKSIRAKVYCTQADTDNISVGTYYIIDYSVYSTDPDRESASKSDLANLLAAVDGKTTSDPKFAAGADELFEELLRSTKELAEGLQITREVNDGRSRTNYRNLKG